jgi:DNA-binding CsgD family transcriptional regulator/tetratricopeptide (TPR) repeat protein
MEAVMVAIASAPALDPSADHVVGRKDELGSLERILDELDQGRSGALALVGEPGIGKTRLLTELGARAESRGHLVLYGSASELERDLPFSVFVDALDEYLKGLDPKQVATLDEEVQAEVARVFPALSALGGGRSVALQQERFRTHRAVRALLEHLARTRPLVLALDDVHWADSASIELLGTLLHRPAGAAVLIALAIRPRQVPERLSAALVRAHRAAALTRVEVAALTRAEARELLGAAVDDAEVAVLFEESGGNPLYLQQLARSLERAGRPRSSTDRSPIDIGIPAAVAASLSEELGLLSDQARRVLEGAAVAGDPFEPEMAADAAETSEVAALDAIDELLVRDLIRQTDVPRRFRFRHPLVRRAVYESTRAGWRLRAHERCAEALAAQGATATDRAHHIERSARRGDRTAVAVLREAGEAAARLAPVSAARWFGAALRLLPPSAPSEERVALLLARAGSHAATGEFAKSRVDLLAGLDTAMRGAPDWRVSVATACAAVEHLMGLQKEAHGHLASALADLGGAASAEAVALMIELSVDRFHAADFDSMHAWAERAVTAARPLGDHALLAAAVADRAWASAVAGDGEWAQQYCDEATELVDELADDVLARRLDALAHLATADLYVDRFPAAARHARRALEIGRATAQGDLFPLVVAMLGSSLWVQGRPREAERLFDGAVEAARLAGNAQSLARMLFNRSFACLVAGDLDEALATAEESYELEGRMEPTVLSAMSAAVYAAALLEAGQAGRSIEVIVAGAGGAEIRRLGGSWRARFLEVLTRALLATGRRTDAERSATAAKACADALGLPSADGMASLAAAALALDAGDHAIAAGRALAAAEAFESVSAAWDAARARELAGRALAHAGERAAAAHQLELAAAAFHAFEAIRYRDQAERELRKLGRHTHRRTRPGLANGSGLETLTERELQVARLVVDRKTNHEIAAELFLSQKTVETHLRNIFNKTGVGDRVALARAVERSDRTASVPPGQAVSDPSR